MKYALYSLKDEKVGFGIPQAENNEQTALRNFDYAVNKKGTLVYENPADFSLWYVGEFDTESGTIVADTHPTYIIGALDVKSKEKDV